jgi:tetrapyrrole methylase family protein/MazG family protein
MRIATWSILGKRAHIVAYLHQKQGDLSMAVDSETSDQPAVIAPIMSDHIAGEGFGHLVGTIARLRAPDGCPWDREQTHASLARNMIEEAHEAVAAIEDRDDAELCEELGDVLLQVVLQAQIAADRGAFSIEEVIDGIDQKMVRRHPHVFGTQAALVAAGIDAEDVETADDVRGIWDRIKLVEHQRKEEDRRSRALAGGDDMDVPRGLLADVPRSSPALMQAQDIIRKAASVGFYWDTCTEIWEKVSEEEDEFKQALDERDTHDADWAGRHVVEEFGDVLFTMVCVAHYEGIDAETALMQACSKFRRRWGIIEKGARSSGKRVDELSLQEKEAFWHQAKSKESDQ